MKAIWTVVLFTLLHSVAFAQEPGSCSYIPGCKKLVEAQDGPFTASIMTLIDALGRTRQILNVTYFENENSNIRFCKNSVVRDLDLVVLVSSSEVPASLRRSMQLSCPRDYGSDSSLRNSARWSFDIDEYPELWDYLFPLNAQGERDYTLVVAAVNSRGQWDSQFGRNYTLKFHNAVQTVRPLHL